MKVRHLILIAVLAVGCAFAQEGKNPDDIAHAEEKSNPNEIYWKWANFAILVGVVGYLAQKNLKTYFGDRNAEIQKGIAEAAVIKADAEKRAAEIEKRMANLEDEIDRLKHEAREEMQREADRMEAETVQLQAKVHAQAEQEITAMTNLARQELKAYSADLALNLAEEEVKRRMTLQIQRELVQRFGTEMARERSVH